MNSAELVLRIARAKHQHLCPECGAKMTETDRVCENGMVFVWYRCSNDLCTGQWLQKTPQMSAMFDTAGQIAGVI
jgi:predicted RNA-binding Zn-ribbon protein involved in translation (DUF1610 family)